MHVVLADRNCKVVKSRSLEQGESQREECQDYLLSMPEADDLEKRDCGIP
jgi:hypothetical protein